MIHVTLHSFYLTFHVKITHYEAIIEFDQINTLLRPKFQFQNSIKSIKFLIFLIKDFLHFSSN